MRRIASHRLLLPDGELLPSPVVTLGDDGRIADIASCADIDRMEGVEFYAGVLLPGFVNAHCHIELSHLHGAIPRRCGFAGFARGMASVRGRFGDGERHEAASAAIARMWSEGVDAMGDISNGAASFAAKGASPVRFRNWAEYFGLNSPSDEPMRRLVDEYGAVVTPHSTYSVQDEPFRRICAAGDGPLSIHFLESPAEHLLYEGRGELTEWYAERGWKCDFLHYGSPARRIAESVPADRRVVLVHNCCLTQEDYDIIAGHFTNPVWWCICPRSNDYISGLEPPVGILRRNGAHICIGTDSAASNEELSMVAELKALRGRMPLTDALAAATRGGAEALGFGDELGSMEVGRRCGVVLLTGVDLETMTLRDDAAARRIF